jgi:hypothetical protein
MFTPPASWESHPTNGCFKTPHGFYLRPHASIAIARAFNSLAVMSDKGVLTLVAGNDFKSLDEQYSGDLFAMTARLNDKPLVMCMRGTEIPKAVVPKPQPPSNPPQGVVFDPNMQDEYIPLPEYKGSSFAPTYGQTNIAGTAVKDIKATAVAGVFSFPHALQSGRGTFIYETDIDWRDTVVHAWANETNTSTEVDCFYGSALLVLNNTNQQIYDQFVNQFDNHDEAEVAEELTKMTNRVKVAFGQEYLDRQAFVTFLIKVNKDGELHILKTYKTGMATYMNGTPQPFNTYNVAGRLVVDELGMYCTMSNFGAFTATYKQAGGIYNEIYPGIPEFYNLVVSDITIKPAYYAFTSNIWNASASIGMLFTPPTSIGCPSALMGIPIERVIGPIGTPTSTSDWSIGNLLSNTKPSLAMPELLELTSVEGAPTTDQQYIEYCDSFATTTNMSQYNLPMRVEWSHGLDINAICTLAASMLGDDPLVLADITKHCPSSAIQFAQ